MLKLCLALGKTRRELLDSLDSQELTAWQAFDRVQPFGDQRADLRSAHIAAAVWNKGRSGNQEPAKLADFTFKYDPHANRPQTPEEVEVEVDALAAAMMR